MFSSTANLVASMGIPRKCGYKRPARRVEGSKVTLPNVRCKDTSIHLTKTGIFALVPAYTRNPSLSEEPYIMVSSEKSHAKYMRSWAMSQKPCGGHKLRTIDIRIPQKK